MKYWINSLALTFLFTVSTASFADNLLINGDFAAGNTKVPAGWSAINNQYEDVQGGPGNPSYYMGNGFGDGTTYLSQTFSDVAGATYDLSFTVYIDNSSQNFFSASIDNVALYSGTDISSATYLETLSFVGTGDDTLQFASYAGGANHLFDVSVSTVPPTPEPSSLILLATGLLGTGGAAWRRRRSR